MTNDRTINFDVNDELFQQVVETAKRATGGDARWCTAIDGAVRMLDGNPYVHLEGEELLVMSDTSLRTYAANGICQCTAFHFGQPCKHRALKRLLQRYYEARERRELASDFDGQYEFAVLNDAPLPKCRPLVSQAQLERIHRLLI